MIPRPSLIWRLPPLDRARQAPSSLADWIRCARAAERAGVDTLLLPDADGYPDPWTVAAALIAYTSALHFMVGLRPESMLPAVAAQAAQSMQSLSGNRLHLLVETDRGAHRGALNADQREERCAEFISIFNALWARDGPLQHRGSYFRLENARLPDIEADRPPVFFASRAARDVWVGERHADGLLFACDSPNQLRACIDKVLRFEQWETRDRAPHSTSASAYSPPRPLAIACVFGTIALSMLAGASPCTLAVPTRSAAQIVARIAALASQGAEALVFDGWLDQEDLRLLQACVLPKLSKPEQMSTGVSVRR